MSSTLPQSVNTKNRHKVCNAAPGRGGGKTECVVYCDIKAGSSLSKRIYGYWKIITKIWAGSRAHEAGCIAIDAIREPKWATRCSDRAIGPHGRLRLPAGAWFIAQTRRPGSFVCKLFDKLTERAHCGDLMAERELVRSTFCSLDLESERVQKGRVRYNNKNWGPDAWLTRPVNY